MPATLQLELDQVKEPSEEMVHQFIGHLAVSGWQTRRQLTQALAVSARRVRALAEAAGVEVVRGPKGFACFENVDADEARHCAEIAISQGKKMIRWGVAVKRRVHQRIG